MLELNQVYNMDCITGMSQMDAESVNACITSPPYWGLRDYGLDPIDWAPVEYSPMAGMPKISIPKWHGSLGLEPTIEMFVGHIVAIFRGVYRVLRDDGTLWLNFGDSYAQDTKWGGITGGKHAKGLHGSTGIGRQRHLTNLPGKNLIGIPWRVAFALQADGWYLRLDIIWSKPNPMPESVTDRPTKAHEYIFLMSKSGKYYYDAEAIKEPGQYRTDKRPFGNAGGNRHGDESKIYTPQKVPSGWDQGKGAHTKKDGRYKADKQRGHGRRHDGFNDRWDQMPKEEQCSMGRNKRSVWTIATQPFSEAHFAVYPEKLIAPCVLAGCPPGGVVFDPFMGAATTAVDAHEYGRDFIGFELSSEYMKINQKRIYERTRQNLLVGI